MKKIVMLCLLFSFVGMTAYVYDSRPLGKGNQSYDMLRLEKELRRAKRENKIQHEVQEQIEKELLETNEGKVYQSARSSHYSQQNKKTLEVALANLQKTSMYQEKYLPSLMRSDYIQTKERCLGLARGFAIDQPEKFDSEKDAMLFGINYTKDTFLGGEPSTLFLEWTNDTEKTEKEVREELNALINGWIASEEYDVVVDNLERLMNN